METTLLSGPGHDWLVVGSNGAIGSKPVRALRRSSHIDRRRPWMCGFTATASYVKASLDLLPSRSGCNPLRLLFCAGKGGFSLADASAEKQYQAFDTFCRLLTRSVDLGKFVFVSSLGAQCSRTGAPYSQLICRNEESVLTSFGEH